MNFSVGCQVQAIFTLETYKESTNELVQKSAESPNIVLNSGLDFMGKGEWGTHCSVGTGNSTPVATQTALDSLVARSDNILHDYTRYGTNTTGDVPYCWHTIRWRFAAGAAKGNITEVGVGWYAGLWNRALILDAGGLPTAITVLDDEYLDVTAEFRFYFGSSTGSFKLLNKDDTVRSEHTTITMPFFGGNGTANRDRVDMYGGDAFGYSAVDLYSTDMVSMTQRPQSAVMRDRSVSSGNNYDVSGELTKTLYLDIGQMVGTHRTFVFGNASFGGNNGFQIQIDPPIVKTSLQAMSYTFKIKWSNYTG